MKSCINQVKKYVSVLTKTWLILPKDPTKKKNFF